MKNYNWFLQSIVVAVCGAIFCFPLIASASAIRIEARYNYIDGSYLDVHATVSDGYDFVAGWNNESTGLNFSDIGGVAYDASSGISYDVASSNGTLELYNTSDIGFGDYGDGVKYIMIDYESFDYPKSFEWKRGLFSHFFITGRTEGVASVPSPIIGGESLSVTPIPLPATVWLFGSGLLSLIAWQNKKSA